MKQRESAVFGIHKGEVMERRTGRQQLNEKSTTAAKPVNIGGQALLEGLVMIGPKNAAMAVRKPDGGIAVEIMPLIAKDLPARIPVLRGIVLFFRQLVLGTKAMMQSVQYLDIEESPSAGVKQTDAQPVDKLQADAQPTDAQPIDLQPTDAQPVITHQSGSGSAFSRLAKRIFGTKLVDAIKEFFNPTKDGKLKNTVVYITVVISLFISIVFFVLLPNVIAGFLHFNKKAATGVFLYNIFEGLFRISIFFIYLIVASKLNDIKRVWQYHGAEHKTIHCYEHGDELTVENVRKYSTKHPRCGTSFLFLVLIVSVIVFSFLGWHSLIVNIISRLLLIPIVAGISYELLKLAGKSRGVLAAVINAPGLAFQRFTTKEPDDSQIEVAIAAFNNALPEGDSDNP